MKLDMILSLENLEMTLQSVSLGYWLQLTVYTQVQEVGAGGSAASERMRADLGF